MCMKPSKPVSLLKLDLLTGYKHQLRVHLSSVLGCKVPPFPSASAVNDLFKLFVGPVLGDTKYGSKETRSRSGLMLHCHELILRVSKSRSTLSATYTYFFVSTKRYKKEGPKKQFDLSIRAPLPPSFVSVCKSIDASGPLDDMVSGVLVDGQDVSFDELFDFTGGVVVSPT